MNELVRPGERQIARLAAPERPGASAASADFSQAYTFDWTALPGSITSVVVDAEAKVAACELDDRDQSVRRRRDTGEYWRPLTVWRATRAGITLLHIRDGLSMVGPKKFAPTHVQELDHAEFYSATTDPSVRRGIVKEEVGGGAAGFSEGDAEPVTSSVDYLPAPVRAELHRLVAEPSFEHSVLVQYRSRAGLPFRHNLRLIRMDAQRAVVVVAGRETELLPSGCSETEAQRIVSMLPWDVTRYSYSLVASQRLPSDRPRLPGRHRPVSPLQP